MSELDVRPEVEPTIELLTSGLEYWLMKEVGSSVVGRNRYLDDFTSFRDNLVLPYEDRSNTNAQKNRSHYNRLEEWTTGYVEHYSGFSAEQRDYATARQIFCGQMYLSGLFRTQCHMQASDQDDYYHRRTDGKYIGIDLSTTVADSLRQMFGFIPKPENFGSGQITLAELAAQTLELNRVQKAQVEELHQTGRFDITEEESPTVDSLLGLQKAWTDLIVSYSVFTAGEHDGQLAAVPFLEPKSITENPAVYRPFAQTT